MFVAVLMLLRTHSPVALLTAADGIYLHAAILRLLSAVDSEAGRTLHDEHRHKHLTLAIVHAERGVAKVRLSFLAEDGMSYANTLITGLTTQSVLQIGQATWYIDAVDLSDHEWGRVSSWQSIFIKSSDRYMRFAFITPTAIMKRDDQGGRFSSLYPEPRDLFAGLIRRWQALDGPELPDGLEHFVHTGGCVVANHHLRTVEFHTTERTQIGFVGHCVFVCRKQDDVYVRTLNALTRFAFFAGVGYQTARGMGAVLTSCID